jgi:DNA-binding transcriptional ArsR family regulator
MVTITRAQSQAIFRALADPTRREILSLLRAGPLAVGELADNFRTSRPAISKHLRLLKSAGLVIAHQRGTANICELNARPLRTVNDWLRDYRDFWQDTLRDLKKYVEEDR